jgi:AAA domain
MARRMEMELAMSASNGTDLVRELVENNGDAAKERDPDPASPAPGYGRPFVEFVGPDEPDDNPADVFEAHGLIVRGEPSLLIGDPKVGKTLLLEDLMLHMAAGRREWCGLRIYRRPRVLLFLREDSERTTKRRLWQLARGAGIEHWELAEHLVIDATSPLYFDDVAMVSKLRGQLASFDVCAIDSLSTIHNADENSVERMAPIMNRWRDLALGTSTAIPLVHHFRKRGVDAQASNGSGSVLQRARGSSLIAATTRHAVGVDRGPSAHEMTVNIESNHEADVQPFVIRRRFGTDERGRKLIKHECAGNLVDAREASTMALVDPLVLAVVRESSADGIGQRELRASAIERIKAQRGTGMRPIKVDESAERLAVAGKIIKINERWRMP